MADFNKLFSQYVSALGISDEKKTEVAATSQAKKAAIGSAPPKFDSYQTGAGISSGKGLQSAGQRELDVRTLSPGELSAKYGPEAALEMNAAAVQGMGQYRRDYSAKQTDEEILYDTGSGVGMGFVNGLAGIGALGAGLAEKANILPDGSGAAVSGVIGDANTWAQSKQSTALNDRRQANQAVQSLDERDNAAKFEQERAESGDFVAGLRRVGRDTMDAVANTVSDPVVVADGIAGGIGSLFGGGAVGKVLKNAGEAAAARVAVGATGPSRAGSMIAKASEKAAMPVAIGALEGGGAYQQTTDRAMEMGATGSEANDAGLMAAAIQAPVGVATGALVSKFEGAPLRVGSIKGAAGNIIRETVEEGTQSGSGQLAENLSLKTVVDPSVDLADGVGAGIGQGALFGMGTAGALQAPGVATVAAVDTARAGTEMAVEAAKATRDAIYARAEKIFGKEKAVEIQRANDAQDSAVASVTELEGLQASVAAKGGDQAPQMADYLTKLFDKARFDPAETAGEADVIQRATQGAADRFTALRQVAEVASDSATSEADRAQAGAYLLKQYSQYEGLLVSDLTDAVVAIDDADPTLPKLREFEIAVGTIRDHPMIVAALAKAQEAASSPTIQAQFTDQAMATPEGAQAAQKTADAVIDLAGLDPDKADAATLDVIRAHAVAGRLNLTPEQRGILDTASLLIRETKAILEQKKALGLSYADRVTQEVQTRDEDGASEVVKKSATEHAKGVLGALRVGDGDLARSRLADLMLFSQHMQNKVDAFNRNYASRRPDVHTHYQALSSKAGRPWFKSAKGLFLNGKNEVSIQLAQQTALDARAVATLANGVAAAFPELGVQSVAPISLAIDPGLNKKATDLVKSLNEPATAPAQEQVSPQKVAEESPVKKAEPVPETTQGVQSTTEDVPEQDLKPETEFIAEESQPVAATEVEAAPELPAEKESFADLVGSDGGKNWFKKAFRLPARTKSRLLGLGESVASTVTEALSSAKAFEAFLGSKPGHELTEAVADGYADLMDAVPAIEAAMAKRLAEFLAETNIDGAKPENPAQTWIRAKQLNIVQDLDGKRTYHPELLQGAILAGLQWLVNNETRPSRELDEQDVANILGVAPTELPEGALEFFNDGAWVTDAKQAIADTIVRFWGVDANPNAPMGYTKGIPEAMAAEVLKGLEEAGLVQIIQDKFGEGDQSKTINRVRVNGDAVSIFEAVAAIPNAIEQVVLTEPVEARFIGEAPKRVPEFQMRNRLVKNTEQQRQAIQAEQDTPHKINTGMVTFLETIGEDLVLKLFGAGEVDETKLNRNHALSLKGKNASVRGAYRALISMVAEVRNRAGVAGVDPSEMPIHYEYNVSRVGRLHMLGLHNPQSSKLMREAILPTRVTLDLTKPENEAKFMLAVAQAWGVKVHKQPRSTSVEQAQKLARDELGPALKALSDKSLSPEELVDTLKSSFGDKMSVAAIHAAMELVRFQQSDERSAFVTDLYVEADGVTDGPINALVHIATGEFSAKWVDLVAKGGLFLGSDGMTVNSFVAQGGEAARDLYQAATDAFDGEMGRFRSGITDPNVSGLLSTLLETMGDLLGSDVAFDGENLTIQRGIAKNPLTVTIYGSGAMGIADKVMGAMTAAFYEELSKSAQGLPNKADKVRDLMEILTDNAVFQGKDGEGLYWKDVSRQTEQPRNSTDVGYSLTADQLKNLRQNVLHLFVTPLRDAIESTIKDTGAGRESLREAVQVQSIFLEHAFKQMVDQLLDEKVASVPGFKRSDFLSQVELEGIYARLTAMSPLIETGTQTFFVAGSEKSDVETTEFSRSLTGDLTSPAYVYGPKDAGVAGIPYLVIGPGDGQMMQNISTMEGAPKGTLKVFDGVHLKLDTLEDDSTKVNQAVHQAWGNNPLGAVNTSFQLFLENASFDDMSADQVEALKKALFSPKEREKVTERQIVARVKEIGSQLKLLSEDAQARHDALAQVAMSVDHMASAEAPYQATGESLAGMTSNEIATRLNALKTEKPAETTTVEGPNEPQKSVEPETQEGPEVLGSAALAKSIARLSAPAELKNLLREAVRALPAGWEVVRGTSDQTSAYAISKGETPHTGRRGEMIKGYTSLSQKRIYLNTQDVETLLHELLHANVTAKIVNHYQGKTSPGVTETVTQLETLLAQWMAKEEDLSGLTPEQRRAYVDALRQVKAELHASDRSTAENKAAGLDEFLAWNLSNQDLIKIAQGTKVENPFARVVKRVLISLKNLIWGRKMAPMVRSDMYSALRFNASVLINATPTLQSRASRITRAQAVGYGTSDRLSELHANLSKKLYGVLHELSPADLAIRKNELAGIVDSVTEAFTLNGFPMNAQEYTAFKMMMTVFATQAKLDPAALARIQELYTHVNKTLTPQDFMDDPMSLDPNVAALAQARLSLLRGYVNGVPIVKMDNYERSTTLPAFLALAMVSDDFRTVLAKLELPKAEKKSNDTLDNILTNGGEGMLNLLARTLSGEGRNQPNIKSAIDALTERLAANVETQENLFSQAVNPMAKAIDGFNDRVTGKMQELSGAAYDKAEAAQAATNNKAAKGLLEVGKAIAAVVNEDRAKDLSEGWIATANRLDVFRPAHDFLNDLIGRTESNAPVYDMIKRVRSEVQQLRQQFREHLPGLIAQRFSRDLTKPEWTQLFKGMGRTDLAALSKGFSVDQVMELLKDPTRQEAEIRRLEDLIQAEAGVPNWKLIQEKAQQLAQFMNTGRPGHHLLKNAEAVSRLMGVPGAAAYTPSNVMIDRVDQLVSLYALESLESPTKDAMATLAQDEAVGLSFVLSYLVGQRTAEQDKLTSDKARVNHYKGYIPSEAQAGGQLKIAQNSEHTRLVQMGYKRMGDYEGSSLEFGAKTRGYYAAPISSRALFNQGIMQNVRQTASGVDPVTGHTHGGVMTAGRIVEPKAVARIARLAGRREAGEPLMPVFDGAGKVIAYERSVDPAQETPLNRDTHLARMIGVWRGRQAEESLAGAFNKLLVKNLHKVWADGKAKGRAAEYVDLMDPDFLKSDPVAADAVSLFTPDALAHIQTTFGGDGFMVRKDMLNDAIGFRSPSVGDLWTGTTRFSPETAKTVQKLVVGVFGANAYRNLVVAEKLTQNLVSEARQLIVVKSVVVPISNFIANIYQLAARGVSLQRIAQDIPKKLVEVNAYVHRRQRQIELEAEVRAAQGNVISLRKIEAELQSILDANKRMTIWPLIEAGEFSSISDAGSLEKEETTLYEGKLTDFIERQVDKLPDGIRTAGKYALVTQDTALFQGMRKAMEYGDFLAKAVTYDHLTQQKKLASDEALARVTEEYVNYDRLSGRFRTYIENMGLLWFWNFKVRIAKIAVATIRENPIHALLTALVPTPDLFGSIGSPLTDNIGSMTVDGDISWSIGPGMGLRSYEMNPLVSLIG